jgi:hypothetical protein
VAAISAAHRKARGLKPLPRAGIVIVVMASARWTLYLAPI